MKYVHVKFESKKCEICGKQFTPTRQRAFVCSKKCRNIRRAKLMPWYKIKCIICGRVIETQREKQETCSVKCGHILTSQRAAFNRQRICIVCNKVFDPGSQSRKVDTCSVTCGHVLLSQTAILKTQKQVEDLTGESAKDWLEREYPGRTMKEICEILGIGHPIRLRRLMVYLGVYVRSKKEQGELIYKQHPEMFDVSRKTAIKVNQNMALNRPTSIEKKMINALDNAGIAYEFQGVVENRFTCDFVLRDRLLIVECDGTYWHSKPEAIIRDARKDAYLQTIGWTILRFSDKVINQDISHCIQVIQKFINHSL